MKKGYIFLLALLVVSCPGCFGRKKSAKASKRTEMETRVDIPLAQDEVRNVFDENIGEFIERAQELSANAIDGSEYAWIEETDSKNGELQKVYFPFDKHTIEPSQEGVVRYNIKRIKQLLAVNPEATVSIGGYCDLYGSRTYNLPLSEKRAKELKNRFIAAGIPAKSIKIVGYGQEMPVVAGGSIEEQAPNRRDEIRIVVS